MTTDEKLEELKKELARQDAELAAAMTALGDAPPNVAVVLGTEMLHELEEACEPRVRGRVEPPVFGLRA
jgi:hypothetical protein